MFCFAIPPSNDAQGRENIKLAFYVDQSSFTGRLERNNPRLIWTTKAAKMLHSSGDSYYVHIWGLLRISDFILVLE